MSPAGERREAPRRDHGRWLFGTAVVALAATFLQPTMPLDRPVRDYVIVLDITQSMNVADVQFDGRRLARLESARQALRQAVPALPCGSRVGWAIFTEYRSFLLFAPVEVCAHHGELLDALAHLGGRMAWSGNSEVAKGLYGALAIARGLPARPAVVFVTDGHEAPPLNPLHRPRFDGTPGEIRGLIVGTGGLTPAPIPKVDPDGKALGFWNADEVMQTDVYSRGREGSISGETMIETETADPATAAVIKSAGAEHLSALREGYLQLLAGETGLAYHRLHDADGLRQALLDPRLARPAAGRLDLRPGLAAVALLALLLAYAGKPRRQRLSRT